MDIVRGCSYKIDVAVGAQNWRSLCFSVFANRKDLAKPPTDRHSEPVLE